MHLRTEDSDSESDSNYVEGDEQVVTVELKSVPITAFATWSVMAHTFGARNIFIYDGKALCHFSRPEKARKFIEGMETDPTLPVVTNVIAETFNDHMARKAEIKNNLPRRSFVWQEN